MFDVLFQEKQAFVAEAQQEDTMSLLSLQKAMAGKELSQAEMFEITRREMAMTQDMYNRCASRVF